MEPQTQPKSAQWAPHLPEVAVGRRSGANAAGPSIAPRSPRGQTEARGTHGRFEDTTPGSVPTGQSHSDVLERQTRYADQGKASELPRVTKLSESTRSASSTAPSTDIASNPQTTTSSTSPPASMLHDQDLGGDSATIDAGPTSGLTSTTKFIKICDTVVAVKQEPGNEDKLQWRALNQRIHMAIFNSCRRYPNLSLQFKLAGASAESLQPTILFVCPPETQKQVRKFVKKHKWLCETECGYKNMILDGNFLRVALEAGSGLDGGLFIRTDMGDVQTLCGKLGRLEGALNPDGTGSRFTIGGVVVVNDTLCCLTTGHVLVDTPDTSELETSEDESETDEELGHQAPASRTASDPDDQKSDEDGIAHSQVSQETRIGKLLTTSNWKRGVLASNEDWSLIRLDAACSTDKSIINQFHYPATEVQQSPNTSITIDKLARTEAELTESEVIILAGYTGLRTGWLNTTVVQLYLDNATFEAREIVTQEPLRMGDSGSWVVQGSKLLGHVFAVQDGTPWSYMIPITQVVEDIQKSLLTFSIELPTLENQAKVSLLCPDAGRSHASLVAFGVHACPSCKQDLRWPEQSQPKDVSTKEIDTEDQVLSSDFKNSAWKPNTSVSSLRKEERHGFSDRSDHRIKERTVPTSYKPPPEPIKADPDESAIHYVPLSAKFVYRSQYERFKTPRKDPSGSWRTYLRSDTPRTKGEQVPYVQLDAVLDLVHPAGVVLERQIRTDASTVLDFNDPIHDDVRFTEITLITPSLNSTFRHAVPWDPSVDTSAQITIVEPYAALVNHLPQLTAYAAKLRNIYMAEKPKPRGSETEKHLTSAKSETHPRHEEVEALVDFTQRFINAADVTTECSRHERNTCTFSKLWLLFKTGMTVYAKDADSKGLNAYIVSHVDTDPSILRPSFASGRPYRVHMWRLNYDGQSVIWEARFVAVDYFDGEQDITTLNVFPCGYLDRADGGETRRKLEERGRRWYQLLRGGASYYSGKLPVTSNVARYWPGELPVTPDVNYEGPVFVDGGGIRDGLLSVGDAKPPNAGPRIGYVEPPEMFEPQRPGFPWTSYGPLNPETTEDLELPDNEAEGKGHRYLLCAPCLPGFLTEKKKWAWVHVDYCTPLKTDPHALDDLMQLDSTKNNIRKLVHGFKSPTTPALQDPQPRKRSGNLIILLHGSSGTGKRYTAERLAEAEGKVLMTIRPGEIGSDPSRARNLLPIWLRLAQKFDAIVLVPGADSFVEQTTTAVGERGDVNSVFWDCLEVYRGIVILTTSRSGIFDGVALSRITFPVRYANLDSETRWEIGKQLVRRLKEENRSLDIKSEAEHLWESTLRKVDWNGHEIKNVLENALATARNTYIEDYDEHSEGPVLTYEDFSAVIHAKEVFEEFVKGRAYNTRMRGYPLGYEQFQSGPQSMYQPHPSVPQYQQSMYRGGLQPPTPQSVPQTVQQSGTPPWMASPDSISQSIQGMPVWRP